MLAKSTISGFAVAVVMLVAASAPAHADVARRCGPDGCAYIHCDWSGNHCLRTLDVRYGYYDCCEPDTGYYPGDPYEGRFLVCDPDGDRCYGAEHPWWNYREYYARLGYEWLDEYREHDWRY